MPVPVSLPRCSYLAAATLVAASAAHAQPCTPPVILQQPAGGAFVAGAAITLHVRTDGPVPLAFQWRRHNLTGLPEAITDGGRIAGATTDTLTIAPAIYRDLNHYSVQISNACGNVTSATVDVTIVSGCYANCDGSAATPFLNVNDIICYESSFAMGEPYADCDHSNTPPVLSVNDFICFLTFFAAGCTAP
jgi:hypothetical protein